MDEVKKNPRFNDDELANMDKAKLIEFYRNQERYNDYLEDYVKSMKQENEKRLKELDDAKNLEIVKLKNLLLMKYMLREQEQSNQLQDMQNMMTNSKLKQTFLDPAVNRIIQQMKKELEECKKQKEEAISELNAWKFNAESHLGKRLVAKCRKLLQENDELGKMVSSGNIATLEADVAYNKKLLSDACENERNLHSFLTEIDSEMDAMQATIIQLQQKLQSLENK